MLFINVPHPFCIVLKRFYCSPEVLSKIPKPIENNRKWVWWVYNEIYIDANELSFSIYIELRRNITLRISAIYIPR